MGGLTQSDLNTENKPDAKEDFSTVIRQNCFDLKYELFEKKIQRHFWFLLEFYSIFVSITKAERAFCLQKQG